MESKETEKIKELRKKLNRANFGKNITTFLSGFLFLAWIFEWTPCVIGNVYLFTLLISFQICVIIYHFLIQLQLKYYERTNFKKG